MPGPLATPAPGTAVVSGAGRGFGAALAAVLVADQWTVYGIVRPGSAAQARASGGVRFLEWDIAHSCPEDVSRVLADASIDVVVNNAAVGSSQKTLASVDAGSLAQLLDNNVAGASKEPATAARELLREFTEHRGPGPRFFELGSSESLPW